MTARRGKAQNDLAQRQVLGLSIVKALATRAGGDAFLANVAGGGLQVSVRLPRLDHSAATGA